MKCPAAAILAVGILAVGGCGSGGHNFKPSDLPRFDLRTTDLPPGYKLVSQRALGVSECTAKDPPEIASKMRSLGLSGCRGTAYRRKVVRPGARLTSDIASEAFQFRDSDAASKALSLRRGQLIAKLQATGEGHIGRRRVVPAAGLGDHTAPGFQATIVGPKGTVAIRISVFAWRTRNVVVLVSGGGLKARRLRAVAKKISDRGGT